MIMDVVLQQPVTRIRQVWTQKSTGKRALDSLDRCLPLKTQTVHSVLKHRQETGRLRTCHVQVNIKIPLPVWCCNFATFHVFDTNRQIYEIPCSKPHRYGWVTPLSAQVPEWLFSALNLWNLRFSTEIAGNQKTGIFAFREYQLH